MQLVEKYRPMTLDDVCGQDRAVATVRRMTARGLAGRAYWISGPSGSGKTTLARIIANEVASEWDTEEIDSQGLTVANVRDLDQRLNLRGLCGRGRAVILNEAHALRKDVIRFLLVALERIPPHAIWAFTTTAQGQGKLFEDCIDADPLLSRCTTVTLAPATDLYEPFAERARTIAQAEGLDGRPMADYVRLAHAHKGNLRAMLQQIEAGVMAK